MKENHSLLLIPMWDKHTDICTVSSVVTLAFIINCLMMSGTIISDISTDVLHDSALMRPLYNVVVGVFKFDSVDALFPLFFYGMTVSSYTSALNVHASVQTIEGIGMSFSDTMVS